MNEQTKTKFVPKNAAYFRAKARGALNGNWGRSIGALFIASICGAFAMGGVSPISTDFGDFKVENLQAFLKSMGPWLLGLLAGSAILLSIFMVARWLFVGSPVALGYERFNLNLVDGQTPAIKILFSGFSAVYSKTVLLRLLLALWALLCCAPVLAAGIVSGILSLPAIIDYVNGAEIATGSAVLIAVAGALLFLSLIATTILSIIISLRFAYATVILAEYPEISPREALQKSASLMQGNKWKLFCLDFSFIGWVILSILSCGIGFIWVTPYMNVARIAFYDEVANRRAAAEAEFPSLDPDDYNTNEETV